MNLNQASQPGNRSKAGGSKILIYRVLLCSFLLGNLPGRASPPPVGVAPIGSPAGGFSIDGDVLANTPNAGMGDWVFSTSFGGAGGGVLTPGGLPINLTTTFHFIDSYGNMGNDLVFVGGLKWTDNPNSWQWTTGKASSKTDLNNALLHISTDGEGHIWVAVSADRLSTSGDSYIDFEFLQNSLTRDAGGAFTSAGPNGGRTTNDILLSLAFSGGGKVADFFAWRWLPNGSGGFAYMDVTAALPTGHVFVALNSNNIPVPYGAFGQTSYSANGFAEAAVDLTGLLGNFDQCLSFGFRTILIKTKASQSASATIEDFVDPIQYSFKIGPSADAGPDQTRCTEGAVTAFALNGTATQGLQAIASTEWSVVGGTVTIDSPGSLITTAMVSSASATLRLTVIQTNGCRETDDIVLKVGPLPVCSIAGPALVCPKSNTQFRGAAGMNAYSWSVSGNAALAGATNAQTVTVVAGLDCGANFTLALTVVSNGCSSACTTDVLVNDTTSPSLFRPVDKVLECPADTRTNVTGVATAQDDCGQVTVSYSDVTTNLCAGSKLIWRTWTARDLCGNSSNSIQIITVRDTSKPTIVCPTNRVLDCPADISTNNTGVAIGQDGCGTVMVTYNDSVTNGCAGTKVIARNWTAIDQCGNSASCVQTITVRDLAPPAITCPSNIVLECPTNPSTNVTGVATAQDSCGSVTVSYSDAISNNCGGTKIMARTWIAVDSCGNSASCIQTITVRDTLAPTITCPASVVLECPANTSTNATGVATAQDGCGSVTVRYADAVTNNCAGTKVIGRTWTATDQCGNSASCVQMITVRDTLKPALVLPPDVVLECPSTNTGTNFTGVATATDGCGQVSIRYTDGSTSGCGATKVIARTWTATDECGNSTSGVQTITVRDTIKPTISCPPNVTLECPADTSTNNTGVATAQDGCGSVTVRYNDAVNTTCGGAKVISRTWTATDACGNNSSCVQTLTVTDTIKPTITCPPSVTMECGGDSSPSRTGTATAQDTCSAVTVSYSDSVNNICGNSRNITRTWKATDSCGNFTTCVQMISLRDTTPPDITCALIQTFSQGGYGGGGEPGQILEDNFTSVFTNGLTIGIYNPGNGNAAPNGLYWQPNATGLNALRTAVSQGGGSGPITQDATNPTQNYGGSSLARQTITLTLNIAFNTAGVVGMGPNNFGSLVYSNGNDSLSGLTINQILGVANKALAGLGLPAGYDYSSLAGLANELNVAFHDYTVGSWSSHLSTPALVVNCPSQVPAPSSAHISVSDNCGGSVTLTNMADVITDYACFNHYTLLRTWVARDGCGNANSCSYNILVNDPSTPTISCPANLVLECPADIRTNVTGIATAQSACGPVSVGYSDTSTNSCGGGRVILRTWTANAGCSNNVSCVQTITVRDITPPTILCPPSVVIDCGASIAPANTGAATAQDGCGTTTISYSDSSSTICGGSRVISRTWTARDACGNGVNGIQTITVRDLVPPTLTCNSNRTVAAGVLWSFDEPVATDACSGVTVSVDNTVTNKTATTLVATRTWTAIDSCGNMAIGQQTISALLVPAPIITSQPASQGVAYSNNLVLNVVAAGTGPMGYQWRFNGTNIAGATGASLNMAGVQFNNAGLYSVVVSNAGGTATSSSTIVNVAPRLFSEYGSNVLKLTWPAPFVLQMANHANGPYIDVPRPTNPYFRNTALRSEEFFRLRSQPFSLLTSNLAGGQFRLECPGVAGCNFIIQASTNLSTWENVQTNPSPFTFVDPNAWRYSRRFYRAVLAH